MSREQLGRGLISGIESSPMKKRVSFGQLTLIALILLLTAASVPQAKRYLEIRRCGKQLAVINQAARVWARAHDDRLPTGFVTMSNELVNPHLLICPGDKS